MRTMIVAMATLTVGCTSNDASDFEYETTFNKRTNGLILHEDGDSGHAGMFGTNCPFDTKSGQVTGDYDLPDENEEIQDGEPTELGQITFTAVTPGVVHVVDKTDGTYTHVPMETPGVSEARLTFDGIVTLDQGCRVMHKDMQGAETSRLPLDGCDDADIEVDPATGAGIVATLGNTARFDRSSLTPLDVQGDLVAWDQWSGHFYLGTRGGHTLSSIDADGTVLWTIETPHPIDSLDDAGMMESAAVVMALADGRGQIAFFDAEAGDLVRSGYTPSPAADLAVSDNGEMLALVRPEQSFFFRLID